MRYNKVDFYSRNNHYAGGRRGRVVRSAEVYIITRASTAVADQARMAKK